MRKVVYNKGGVGTKVDGREGLSVRGRVRVGTVCVVEEGRLKDLSGERSVRTGGGDRPESRREYLWRRSEKVPRVESSPRSRRKDQTTDCRDPSQQ